jgi:hypothetical protein
MLSLLPHLARQADTLLFDYESTGNETYFRDEPASALLARLAVQAAEPPPLAPPRPPSVAQHPLVPAEAAAASLDEWCQQ